MRMKPFTTKSVFTWPWLASYVWGPPILPILTPAGHSTEVYTLFSVFVCFEARNGASWSISSRLGLDDQPRQYCFGVTDGAKPWLRLTRLNQLILNLNIILNFISLEILEI